MACSLIKHKRITTTVAKAKALRVYVEPIITKSKEDSTHSRRVVFSQLQDKEVVTELFREVAPKVANRPGGYTRIIRLGNRIGDNAEMCMMELVDFNELLLNDKKSKTRRSRRSGGKKKTTAEAATAETAEVKEAPKPKEAAADTAAAEKEAPAQAKESKEAQPKAEAKASEEKKAEEPKADKEQKDDKESK